MSKRPTLPPGTRAKRSVATRARSAAGAAARPTTSGRESGAAPTPGTQGARYGSDVCNSEVNPEEFAGSAKFTAGAREALAANGESPTGAAARVARTIADLHDRMFADANHVTDARYYATQSKGPVE